jgi:hypothetical protein
MGYIDWSSIHTVDDLKKVDPVLLYDEAEIRDPIDMRKLRPDLTEEELEDAMFWKRFVNGIMLVVGEPGAGKGVFLHMCSYKLKYYFVKLPSSTRGQDSLMATTYRSAKNSLLNR